MLESHAKVCVEVEDLFAACDVLEERDVGDSSVLFRIRQPNEPLLEKFEMIRTVKNRCEEVSSPSGMNAIFDVESGAIVTKRFVLNANIISILMMMMLMMNVFFQESFSFLSLFDLLICLCVHNTKKMFDLSAERFLKSNDGWLPFLNCITETKDALCEVVVGIVLMRI